MEIVNGNIHNVFLEVLQVSNIDALVTSSNVFAKMTLVAFNRSIMLMQLHLHLEDIVYVTGVYGEDCPLNKLVGSEYELSLIHI